jgi:hypothetical protein
MDVAVVVAVVVMVDGASRSSLQLLFMIMGSTHSKIQQKGKRLR